jgi:hypothetical protein
LSLFRKIYCLNTPLKTRMINLKGLERLEDLARDRTYLNELFEKYPHLATEAIEFDEFMEEH